MTPLIDRYRRVLDALAPRAVAWLAGLAAVVVLLAGGAVAGSLLALGTIALVLWVRLATPGGDRQQATLAALAVVAALGTARQEGWTWPLLACLVAVLGLVMAEATIDIAIRPGLRASGLPGLRVPPAARVPHPAGLGAAAAVACLVLPGLGVGVGVSLAGAALAVLAGLGVAGYQLVRERRHDGERAVRAALAGLAPTWVLYYNGTGHGAYQVRMWLPYLARTGARGVLVIRDPRFLPAAAELGVPVVLARSVESLEYVAVPGITAFFYVNNDAKNVNGVRFGDITHVHLGHGDSDKPASYSATFAMFDQVFVAGQAAVDRFTQHGVVVPREKFRLVGRPQVEHLRVREPGADIPADPVVLYAPTWRGGLEDSLFGSLRSGERIVAALLEAGATVWFRPHPYSVRDAESRVLIRRIDALLASAASRPHRQSAATATATVFECMNASDAMVTDVSSLASDYLYTNKPFAITDTGVVADVEAAYPLARAAVLVPLAGDLDAGVRELLGDDTRRAVRAELRRYYLGDHPPQTYASVFVTAARQAMGLEG